MTGSNDHCVCRGCASPMCNAIKGSKDARCNRTVDDQYAKTPEGVLCVPCSAEHLKAGVAPK